MTETTELAQADPRLGGDERATLAAALLDLDEAERHRCIVLARRFERFLRTSDRYDPDILPNAWTAAHDRAITDIAAARKAGRLDAASPAWDDSSWREAVDTATPAAGQKPPPQRRLAVAPGYGMFNSPPPKIAWLVERLIPRGSTFCLNGRGGIWKSWTFTSLAVSVGLAHLGTKFMGHFACPVDEPRNAVLYIQLEESRSVAAKKYRWILNAMGLGPEDIQDALVEYIVGQPLLIDDAKRMDQLKIVIDELKPDLVLWDNVRRMKTGNANDSSFAGELANHLKSLQEIYPSAHGLIHHWRKRQSERGMNDPGEMGSGNAALRDACDVWLPVERDKVNDFATMTCDKQRDGKELAPFNFACRIDDRAGQASIDYIGNSTDASGSTGCTAALLELMRADPKRVWKKPEVVAGLADRFTEDQVRYAYTTLERAKTLFVEVGGGRKPTLLALRSEVSEQLKTDPAWESGNGLGKLVPGRPTPFKDDE